MLSKCALPAAAPRGRGREEGSKEGRHRALQKNEVDNGGGNTEEEEEAQAQAEKVENENNAAEAAEAAAIAIENLSERGQRERECCVGGKKQTERKRGRDRERASRQAKV